MTTVGSKYVKTQNKTCTNKKIHLVHNFVIIVPKYQRNEVLRGSFIYQDCNLHMVKSVFLGERNGINGTEIIRY